LIFGFSSLIFDRQCDLPQESNHAKLHFPRSKTKDQIMSGNELRQKYLDFFKSKNSLVVPSASLIPTDPTTLLTSAGMQPFVPYFKGEEKPPSPRLASCQKCCRTDDFDHVGVTWRHASFFEMLGNFSFGDYFKREAIIWGWEFLTQTLNLDPKLLWISVYEDDPDAAEIWKKDVGLTDDRIYRFGKKDNWWGPVGKTGPCGPDSEIFFDRGPQYDTGDPELDRPGGDGDRYGELWNLVFQQYNQQENGELLPLPAPGIDTGMGLERTAAVLQNVDTIHHTDLFAPIINAIAHLGAISPNGGEPQFSLSTPSLDPENPQTRPLKVIADHARAAIFMAGDGIVPGNSGRDYMLRRLIRRAFLFGHQLGYDQPFVHRLAPIIAQGYGEVYPEVRERETLIADLIRREEERFHLTLASGMNRLDDLLESLRAKNETVLPGAEVFRLYETFGFPPEMTEEVARENGFEIDEAGFAAAAEAHSKISGSAVGEYEARAFGHLETEFVGYEQTSCDAKILAVSSPQSPASSLQIVLDRTPFYAESGGQVGDEGELIGEKFRARVLDTQKQGKAWVHEIEILEGEISEGQSVRAVVDIPRRQAIQRAHSATHLLHAALRKHLGKHVEQRGSLVEGDRLRFDFVHFAPISDEELERIEDAVNEEVLASLPVEIRAMSLEEAKAEGAMALFGEKYGDVVRTVRMGEFSLELCGGTHLKSTAEAGFCRIVSESGVGANLRRIEALTGAAALRHDRTAERTLKAAAGVLGARPDALESAAEKLKQRVRELEKQLQAAQQKLASSSGEELLQNASEIHGVQFAAGRAPQGLKADALRELADQLANKLNGVIVLAAEDSGKVLWAVKASKSAVERGAHAGNLVRELAKITGGGGGGRPDFAQAGGKEIGKINDALQQASELFAAQIAS
jgi:alanyl-tRNA synthetase